MKKAFIETGKIVNVHGVRGEVKIYPWNDDLEFLSQIRTMYLDEGKTPLVFTSLRIQKSMLLGKIQGVDTIEAATAYRNKVLYLKREDIPLEEGEYLWQDLLGLKVLDADTGKVYGELCDISQTGANDVYHIRFADGKERYIPAIREVVISVDIDGGEMKIRPLEGLFDDAD